MQMMGSGATSTVALNTATMTSMSTMSTTNSMGSMSMYLMNSYLDIPVVFKSLYATDKATCFAIFVVLFFTGFMFRGVAFMSTYIEQKIFRDYDEENIKSQVEKVLNSKVSLHEGNSTTVSENEKETTEVENLRRFHSTESTYDERKQRSIIAKFFSHSMQSIYQDFIRLILTFVQVMVAYFLMLAVMTCVIPYFFAVCLGIAFGEVFFLRLGHCYGLNPTHINGSLH